MKTLLQKVTLIKKGKLKAVENVMDFAEEIKKKNKKLNIYLHLNNEAIDQAKEIDKKIKEGKKVGKLAGLCFAVKSNICVKHMTSNCASKVLEDYTAGYNATVIQKLKEEDAIVLGMVNMDEFASGGSGETSAFGPTKNPLDNDLITGGSSSGSAAAVAAGLCDFALGSDTGGSIRNPASHCGVVGLKPTYGAVSRYGLLDLSMSLDCIGPLANSAEDAEFVFDIIKGQDNFDTTTYEKEVKSKKKYRIGVVNVANFCENNVLEMFNKKVKQISEDYETVKIDLPLDIAIETYYLLVYVEFFSATRKFDGRRFGQKIEEEAGPEVLRRIIGGSEISKAEHEGRYYREALRAKKYIEEQFEKLFEEVDLIVLPTVPKLPHKIGEKISVEEMYAYDVFTILASLAGLPAISVPIEEKLTGLQVIAPQFSEKWIFDFLKE